MYFDSHCHLDFKIADGELAQAWPQAMSRGITRAVIPGTDPAQWAALPALCAKLDGVQHAVGLHPWWVENWWLDNGQDLGGLRTMLSKSASQAAAIGETGLDKTTHAKASLQTQIDCLEVHVEVAAQLGLPLVLHCVRADAELLEVLQSLPLAAGGMVHSFSGSVETAERYLDLGLHLSFSCAALRFGTKKRKAVAAVPVDRLLIETDAPDQSIERSRTGSPLDVIEVAAFVATERKTSQQRIADVTFQNASQLFHQKRLFTP